MVGDHELKETVRKLVSALEEAKLTPTGIAEARREIRKWLMISGGCIVGAVLLFLLLLDTKVHGDFYQLGVLAAVVLSIADILGFVVGFVALWLVCGEWWEVRRSRAQSSKE